MVSFLTPTTSRLIAANVNISELRGHIRIIEQNYNVKALSMLIQSLPKEKNNS